MAKTFPPKGLEARFDRTLVPSEPDVSEAPTTATDFGEKNADKGWISGIVANISKC